MPPTLSQLSILQKRTLCLRNSIGKRCHAPLILKEAIPGIIIPTEGERDVGKVCDGAAWKHVGGAVHRALVDARLQRRRNQAGEVHYRGTQHALGPTWKVKIAQPREAQRRRI